ncbi:MAG: T9SS type A sorting domain-containing protein [Proteobacteria bacterium]|nr:T9SS type A sorting domain-containing protein [Pseudomonadota bacterium]
MKKFLPVTIVLCILTVANAFSQSRKFFAVTGDQFGSVNWIVFRQFDLDDATKIKTIYVPAETNEVVYDALTASPLNNTSAAVANTNPSACGCLNTRMVAAIAYDEIDNRLYYTTMMGNQLRYLDLNEDKPKSYAVTTQLLKNFPNLPGEASNITRMCFAANGFGYALTNDNQHLIQFSTQKRGDIKDLGNLIDAKTNADNSIKTQIKSWGGDMIADANGLLYLFTMQKGIFKINPVTKVATYLGNIKNIADDYTINAAMAIGGSNVIVASSTNTSTYYKVDLTTLQATALNTGSNKVYNVSDFANATLAFDDNKKVSSVSAKTLDAVAVNIYPNPVTAHNFYVQLSNFAKGKYTIEISQLQGKKILQKEIDISGSQTEKINLPSGAAAGAYLIKIINGNGESVYNDKIIVAN